MSNLLETSLLSVIRSTPGILTLKNLIDGFSHFGFTEKQVRTAMIQLERDGLIYANWDWKYTEV